MSSIHGTIASPYKSAYISAKHGLSGLTKTVALELGIFGITVNAICPAYVRTPIVDKQIRPLTAALLADVAGVTKRWRTPTAQ